MANCVGAGKGQRDWYPEAGSRPATPAREYRIFERDLFAEMRDVIQSQQREIRDLEAKNKQQEEQIKELHHYLKAAASANEQLRGIVQHKDLAKPLDCIRFYDENLREQEGCVLEECIEAKLGVVHNLCACALELTALDQDPMQRRALRAEEEEEEEDWWQAKSNLDIPPITSLEKHLEQPGVKLTDELLVLREYEKLRQQNAGDRFSSAVLSSRMHVVAESHRFFFAIKLKLLKWVIFPRVGLERYFESCDEFNNLVMGVRQHLKNWVHSQLEEMKKQRDALDKKVKDLAKSLTEFIKKMQDGRHQTNSFLLDAQTKMKEISMGSSSGSELHQTKIQKLMGEIKLIEKAKGEIEQLAKESLQAEQAGLEIRQHENDLEKAIKQIKTEVSALQKLENNKFTHDQIVAVLLHDESFLPPNTVFAYHQAITIFESTLHEYNILRENAEKYHGYSVRAVKIIAEEFEVLCREEMSRENSLWRTDERRYNQFRQQITKVQELSENEKMKTNSSTSDEYIRAFKHLLMKFPVMEVKESLRKKRHRAVKEANDVFQNILMPWANYEEKLAIFEKGHLVQKNEVLLQRIAKGNDWAIKQLQQDEQDETEQIADDFQQIDIGHEARKGAMNEFFKVRSDLFVELELTKDAVARKEKQRQQAAVEKERAEQRAANQELVKEKEAQIKELEAKVQRIQQKHIPALKKKIEQENAAQEEEERRRILENIASIAYVARKRKTRRLLTHWLVNRANAEDKRKRDEFLKVLREPITKFSAQAQAKMSQRVQDIKANAELQDARGLCMLFLDNNKVLGKFALAYKQINPTSEHMEKLNDNTYKKQIEEMRSVEEFDSLIKNVLYAELEVWGEHQVEPTDKALFNLLDSLVRMYSESGDLEAWARLQSTSVTASLTLFNREFSDWKNKRVMEDVDKFLPTFQKIYNAQLLAMKNESQSAKVPLSRLLDNVCSGDFRTILEEHLSVPNRFMEKIKLLFSEFPVNPKPEAIELIKQFIPTVTSWVNDESSVLAGYMEIELREELQAEVEKWQACIESFERGLFVMEDVDKFLPTFQKIYNAQLLAMKNESQSAKVPLSRLLDNVCSGDFRTISEEHLSVPNRFMEKIKLLFSEFPVNKASREAIELMKQLVPEIITWVNDESSVLAGYMECELREELHAEVEKWQACIESFERAVAAPALDAKPAAPNPPAAAKAKSLSLLDASSRTESPTRWRSRSSEQLPRPHTAGSPMRQRSGARRNETRRKSLDFTASEIEKAIKELEAIQAEEEEEEAATAAKAPASEWRTKMFGHYRRSYREVHGKDPSSEE